MSGMNYVCLYVSYLESLDPFTNEKIGRIVKAMLAYASAGEFPQFSGNERFIWPTLKAQIDRDESAYRDQCEKNRANGAKRGRPQKNRTVIPATECFLEKPKKAKEKRRKEKRVVLRRTNRPHVTVLFHRLWMKSGPIVQKKAIPLTQRDS